MATVTSRRSPVSPADPFRQTSDMRTTVDWYAPHLDNNPLVAWQQQATFPSQLASSTTPPATSSLAMALSPSPVSMAAQPGSTVEHCAECHTASNCRESDCSSTITDECTDQCVVVACTDPSHTDACEAVSEPCPDGAECTAFVDEILACCGGETHDWLASLKPGPWDPELDAFLCECGFGPSHSVEGHPHVHHDHNHTSDPHDMHHSGHGHEHRYLPHPKHNHSPSFSTSPHVVNSQYHENEQASALASPPLLPTPPEPNMLPTHASLSPNFNLHTHNQSLIQQLNATHLTSHLSLQQHHHHQIGGAGPQAALSVSPEVCKCMWANCSRVFDSFAALVGHVNVDHLRLGPVSPAASTATTQSSTTLLTLSPPTPSLQPRTNTQDANVTLDDSGLSCYWGECEIFPPVPGTLGHGGGAVALGPGHPGATPSMLAAHLMEHHLGVPMELLATWPKPTVKDLLSITHQHEMHPPPGQPDPQNQTSRAMASETPQLPPSPESLTPSSPRASASGVGSEASHSGPSTSNCVCRWQGCMESFPTVDALTAHLDEVHVGSGRAWYECYWEGCGRCGERGFGSRQKVRRHLQSHTGYRPFVCKVCGQNFSEAATLQQHLRRHTQHKPYVCDFPGCGKAFTVTGALTIHKRTHNGQKPFRCTFCDKAFAESSNLSKHLRTHTGARPYSCLECDKAFARPDQLARHTAMHRRKGAPEDEAG